MVPLDKPLPPPSLTEAEPPTHRQASAWPLLAMALLVLFSVACLLLVDIRIGSLLSLAACAVMRYIAARHEED
jgi:hypothetical protein